MGFPVLYTPAASQPGTRRFPATIPMPWFGLGQCPGSWWRRLSPTIGIRPDGLLMVLGGYIPLGILGKTRQREDESPLEPTLHTGVISRNERAFCIKLTRNVLGIHRGPRKYERLFSDLPSPACSSLSFAIHDL